MLTTQTSETFRELVFSAPYDTVQVLRDKFEHGTIKSLNTTFDSYGVKLNSVKVVKDIRLQEY